MKLPSGLEFSVPSEMFERILPVIMMDNPHAFVYAGAGKKKSQSLTIPLICSSLAWACIALAAALWHPSFDDDFEKNVQ